MKAPIIILVIAIAAVLQVESNPKQAVSQTYPDAIAHRLLKRASDRCRDCMDDCHAFCQEKGLECASCGTTTFGSDCEVQCA